MKLIRPLPLLLLCALLLAGCGQGGGAPQEQETAQTQTGPTWESRAPSEAFQGIQGCAVLYDLGTDHYTLYQEDLCRTQVSSPPAPPLRSSPPSWAFTPGSSPGRRAP